MGAITPFHKRRRQHSMLTSAASQPEDVHRQGPVSCGGRVMAHTGFPKENRPWYNGRDSETKLHSFRFLRFLLSTHDSHAVLATG